MALPNTEKLTSQLAMLPDSALRQMAQMHKADPYILPLIIAEDGRRKQVRMAGQAQQYQPQPKVAEAEAAQVGMQLPENVGIGALPAPNMAQMAGGGITGEEDDVPGYAGGGEPGVYERWKAMSTPYNSRVWGDSPTAFSDLLSNMGQNVSDFVSEEQARADRARAAELERLEAQNKGRRPRRSNSEAEQVVEQALLDSRAGSGAPGPAPVSEQKGSATANSTSGATNSGTQSGPAVPRGESLESLFSRLQKTYGTGANQPDPFAEQRKAITEAKVSDREKALKEFDEDAATRTPFGAEREKRLMAKEEKLAKDEKDLGGLALLEAGLAIMSGTSQYAAANIGAGAGVGLKAYKQGKKDIEDARDKLDDARSLIDEYRRNEAEMTKKERRGMVRDINAARTEGLESLLSGAEKMYGYSRDDVTKLLAAATAERTAHIKGGYEVQAAGVRAGAGHDQKLAALAASTRQKILDASIKAFPYDPAKREKFVNDQLAQALQFNPDLAQYMGASGGGGAPSAKPNFVFNPQTGQVEPVR